MSEAIGLVVRKPPCGNLWNKKGIHTPSPRALTRRSRALPACAPSPRLSISAPSASAATGLPPQLTTSPSLEHHPPLQAIRNQLKQSALVAAQASFVRPSGGGLADISPTSFRDRVRNQSTLVVVSPALGRHLAGISLRFKVAAQAPKGKVIDIWSAFSRFFKFAGIK